MARGGFRRAGAEIGRDHGRVRGDLARAAAGDLLALMKHHHPARKRHDDFHDVLDDDERDAGAMNVAHEVDGKLDLALGETGHGFVEQQHLWLGGERAGKSARRLIPTRSSTARAFASASWRRGVRRKAPIITFSSTDMRSKVCGTWKVRASPSSARASGIRAVMSWPSKNTLPAVAAKSPVRQLKKVDLPAPFGPIRPRMSPCSSVTLAESTALKLPKAFVMSRASRSMACSLRCAFLRRLAASGEQSVDQLQYAAGLEARDQHDDGAIDDKGEARALAAEHAVGDFLQRHQDRRTHQRAEQHAGAAECRHDQHLHRDQDTEP